MPSLNLLNDLIAFIDKHRSNLAQQILDSDAAWRQQFDPNSKHFHGGIATPVPVGGNRIPTSMQGPLSIHPAKLSSSAPESYGPEYDKLMEERKSLNLLKKKISSVCTAIGSQKMLETEEIQGQEKADKALRELENMYKSFPKEGQWGSIILEITKIAQKPLATAKKEITKLSTKVNRQISTHLRNQLAEIKAIKNNFTVSASNSGSVADFKSQTKFFKICTHSVVANMDEAASGRKKIAVCKSEMQGLITSFKEFGKTKPLKGARISCSLHITSQAVVFIEILSGLGADIRCCSCDISKTQDHAAAAMAAAGIPVFAWEGASLEEYRWCIYQCLSWPHDKSPNMIIDNGGDLTLLVHEGVKIEDQFKKDNSVPDPNSTNSSSFKNVFALLQKTIGKDPKMFTKMACNIIGVSEGTTIGAHRLNQMTKDGGTLLFPAIHINDSMTKRKFDTRYGCRHSLPDGIMRATDAMISGKRVLICGFGEVGKGCAESMLAAGARVFISEIDPICALQGLMEGMNVVSLEDVVNDIDIVITATGNKGIVKASHMAKMKNNCIVGNIGNFDDEIDMTGLAKVPGIKKKEIKPGVHRWEFPDGHGVIILAEGRLLNLECSTGPPSLVISCIWTNHVFSLLELWNERRTTTKKGKYKNEVYALPKTLDEKVARFHVDQLGGMITELSQEQASYIGVSITGPYKPASYRY